MEVGEIAVEMESPGCRKSQSGGKLPSAVASTSRKGSVLRPPAAPSIDDGGTQIGALSKVEAEFDFAIILKPSRSDEFGVVDSSDHRASLAPPPATNLKAFYKKNPHQATAELLRRLHTAGLQTKRIRSLDGKQLLVKVKAPQDVLEFGAEQMKLKKQRRGDLMWVEFSSKLRSSFVDFDAAASPDGVMQFLDKDKQSIVHFLLTSDDGGARLNEHNELFAAVVEHMMPLHKANLEHLRQAWVCYWRSPSPSPSPTWIASLACCGRLFRHCLSQPLDDVAKYFGEKVAFYFAWVEMYTRWLVAPVVVGIFLFVQQVQSSSLDQPLAPFYALFMAVWASSFLVAWKRWANSLAYRWGVLGYEEDEEVLRPAFRLSAAPSRRTWTRWLKYAVTWSVVVVCIGVILAIMYAAFSARDRLQQESLAIQNNVTTTLQQHELTLSTLSSIHDVLTPQFWFYCLVMPMLYGLCIPLLDIAFTWLATVMTTWENHETESAHQSALIVKVFPFRCIHVFATLYYYAFTAGDNLLRVAIQLATFMLSGQMWNNVVKTGVPLLRRRYQLRRKRQATSKLLDSNDLRATVGSTSRQLQGLSSVARAQHQCLRLEHATSEVWDECHLYPYDTFEDYTEMLIQFGYVSFFSIAFPLAPLLAFVNNVVSLRVVAFKVCHTTQRPRASKASGIGIWFPVLQMMSVVAVITNCLHVAFTTTQIEQYVPTITPSAKVWVVFVAEHAVVALQFWIAFAVPAMTPDIAAKVRLERAFAKSATATFVTSFHVPPSSDADPSIEATPDDIDIELVI